MCGHLVARATVHGIIKQFFLIHDDEARRAIADRILYFHPERTLDAVRHYFGERIGLYFAWMLFWTKWLWLPGVLGIALFIYQCAPGVRVVAVSDCSHAQGGGAAGQRRRVCVQHRAGLLDNLVC
jgi:hypothetical protein